MAGPLDFRSIPIDHLKDVKISIDVQGRTQGRRFTVKYGDSEKQVVFHELYKNAQSLLRDHENLSEKDIKDIHAFVGTLKDVEREAKAQYKQGSAGYRLLTFAHRLFGGSFTGTHLHRLIKLEAKLDQRAQPKLLEYITNNKENFDMHFHEPMEVTSGDRTFVVNWQKDSQRFIISEKDKEPQRPTHCIANGPDGYLNFEGILGHAVSIFNEIDIQLTSRVNDVDVNSQKRVDVLDSYQRIHNLSSKHPILNKSVIHNGITYNITLSKAPLSDNNNIIIRSSDLNQRKVLKLTREGAEYNGAVSGIPRSHVPILDELQRRVADHIDEIVEECNQINEEVINRAEAFRVVRLLSSEDPALRDPIVVDGVTYSIACSMRMDTTEVTIQKEPKVGNEGKLILYRDSIYAGGYVPITTIPADLLPVCNALYARIVSKEDEIRQQNEKRDQVVSLYERLHGLMADHPVLTDPVEVDGKSYKVKFSIDYFSHRPKIEIQEQGYDGFRRELRIENGQTTYEYSEKPMPAEFIPVLDQLQRRVDDNWQEIMQECVLMQEAKVRGLSFVMAASDLADEDPFFSRQMEIEGISYSFEKNSSGLKIAGNGETLEISESGVKHNGRLSGIPPHFAAVMDEFMVNLRARVNVVNQQTNQRNEFFNNYRIISEADSLDPVFIEQIDHDGKTYYIEEKKVGYDTLLFIKNHENQDVFQIGGRDAMPEHLQPVFDGMCAKYAERLKAIEPVIKQREGIVDLYKNIMHLNPDLEIFNDPIVVEGKTYRVIAGMKQFTVQEQGEGVQHEQLRFSREITQYGTKKMLTPEHMRPVLDVIASRLQAQLDELEKAEMDVLDVIFDDPELLDHAITLLKKEGVTFTGSVAVWKEDGVLHLQDKKYAGTEQGVIKFASDNSIMAEENRENTQLLLKKALFSACVQASAYDLQSINLLRESVSFMPIWHLNMLKEVSEDFRIHYKGEAGIDIGGLKRDYIGNLSAAVSNEKSLFGTVGSLKLPRIVRTQEKGVLYCNAKEAEAYEGVGQLLYRCYESEADASKYHDAKLITTGRLFSDSLFNAALTLSKTELKAPRASRVAELKMSKALLKYFDSNSSAETIKNMIKCIDLLEPGKLEASLVLPVSDDLKMALFLIGEDDGELYMNDDDFGPDIEKIKADIDGFKAVLFNAIMNSTAVDELEGISLGSVLDPVFQIAKGMQDNTPAWDVERELPAVEMSSKIQGSINRAEIADSIIVDVDDPNGAPVLDQKVLWLKEWLNDEASDEEVKDFLKFATGSTSLAKDVKIKVDSQSINQPLMTSSTCNRTLHMSNANQYGGGLREEFWDHTKEGFIRNLKKALVENSYQSG